MDRKPLRVVCYVPTFNAGDTTRGIEVARALRAEAEARGRNVEITFVCPPIAGFHFEPAIARAGFAIGHTAVPLSDKHIVDFMNADRTGNEFVPELPRARLYIEKYAEDIRARAPDLVINGCIPPAGIASRLVGVPTVTYLPFPGDPGWVKRHLLKDIPDELENAFTLRLPRAWRRRIVRAIGGLALKKPFFTQPTLAKAGRALGWKEPAPGLFTMLAADVDLVTDLPDFYEGQNIGPRAKITGPLFSLPASGEIDSRILEVFRPENPNKVLVTMGSSGVKSYFLDAVAAVVEGGYHAVVVAQPTICSVSEVRARFALPDRVYLTDAFVPAHRVNPLADAVVIHGGQGTVQTTAAAGVPFVGVSMQAEQQANLDNLVARGAGLRIPRKFWRADRVHSSLERVLREPSFRANAAKLAESYAAVDGWAGAGAAIWELVEARGL